MERSRQRREEETLADLISSIYDAARDPRLWSEVVARIEDFVGGHANRPFPQDRVRSEPSRFPNSADYDGESLEEFVAKRIDPSTAGGDRRDVADNEKSRRIALIMPHVRRAVLICKVIDRRQADAAAFADVIDGLAAGILLVDSSARIVHVNASGRALLHREDFVRVICGRLVFTDEQIDQTFEDAIAAAGSGDDALGPKCIDVPLIAFTGEHYVGHILPLTAGRRRSAGVNYDAVAALFVRKAVLETPSPPEVIAKSYKLTPTELRVLLAIVELGGIPDVAVALGIGQGTIKTHLNRLFDKTGTRRQAELVKIVAGFSSPLVSR
jgi:DNA-binding CsgD family transcriptional regulator